MHGRKGPYAFVSISGGSDGGNPKLEEDLVKRMGKQPLALIDMHIADLRLQKPKPNRQDTMAYRLQEEDVEKLTEHAVTILQAEMSRS